MVLVWGLIRVSDHPDGGLFPTIDLIELVKSEDCIVLLHVGHKSLSGLQNGNNSPSGASVTSSTSMAILM